MIITSDCRGLGAWSSASASSRMRCGRTKIRTTSTASWRIGWLSTTTGSRRFASSRSLRRGP